MKYLFRYINGSRAILLMMSGQEISKEKLTSHFGDNDVFMLAKMAETIVNFYLGITKINQEVFKPLLDF